MNRGLHLRFEEPASFRDEYARNIEKGGAFVRTPDLLEPRSLVEVAIELAWCDEAVLLEAEVVYCTPPGTDPSRAGVAVHFLVPVHRLCERLGRFVEKQDDDSEPVLELDGLELDGIDPEGFDLETEGDGPLAPAFDESGAAGPDAPAAVAEHLAAFDEEEEGDPVDRRRAARHTARVPIQVASPQISLDGRTRDLSENGVLLSADGSDLPLGKQVRLSLTHPNTGERLEIDGTVARHVESGGTVAAVGIAFDPRLDGDQYVRDFIHQVKASESVRRESGISGLIEELGMANLLQMFGTSPRGGTFTAATGAEEGVIAFEAGRLRYARLGPLRGIKALSRMLSWEHGAFEFQSQVDALPDEDEPVSLDAAILEAVRQLDEARRAQDGLSLDPHVQLQLRREGLVALEGSLSQTEEAVIDLAAAGLTVRRLLDVIPEPDADILDALDSLRERGVVSLVGPGE